MQPVISDSQNFVDEPRPLAEMEGAEPAQDNDAVIRAGGRAIEAHGNDLGRMAEGHLRDADIDTARQRLRDCQGALISLGYQLGDDDEPAGHVSGVMDAATLEAVKQFQDDNDLEVTGIINRDTYEALLSGFEQAMSMRAQSELDDDFMPMHAGEATQPHTRGLGDAQLEASGVIEPIDDSEESLLALRDELAQGSEDSPLAEDP